MKQYLSVFAFLVIAAFQANAQLYISSGATFAAKESTSLVPVITLQDIDLVNNGTFVPSYSDFRFQKSVANSDKTIGGSSVTSFDYLFISLDNLWLTLLQNVQVDGQVIFESGQCNLNNKTVTLNSAFISGENNASSFVGPNGGEIVTTVNLNAPNGTNPGSIGARITTAKNLGEVTIRRTHLPVSSGGGQSIKRKYTITAANNSDLDATLRLSYLDKELNGTTENNLSLWRKEGADWYGKGYSSRDANADWVEQTGIDAFSEWTLGNAIFTPVIDLDQGHSLTIGNLFPNPSGSSSSRVQFEVDTPRDLDLHLRVIDPLGRIVLQQVQHVIAGNQLVSLETLDWSPGMYIIQLATADESAQLTLNKL